MTELKIFIITGRSGSGKSTAIAALEDAGFYCVDNMPVALLPRFLELQAENASDAAGFAFVMDLREKDFLAKYKSVIDGLKDRGYQFEIIFLEADEKILLQRYSQTRRQHPLSRDNGRLHDAIQAEKVLLRGLRKAADRVLDTSNFTVHELKAVVLQIARKSIALTPMRIHLMSFGFKYGVPHDADLIVDVRFLPNPYFVAELKPLDGLAPEIARFALDNPVARGFIQKYTDLLDYLIPLYEKEGKAYLTIAVGCTGGRHRSVAVAEALFDTINGPGKQVDLTHRDIGQEKSER